MKLWIVYSGYDYAASYIHGIFDSQESAELALSFIKNRERDYHDYMELELGLLDGTGESI
jgi:hypothetical protein